MHQPPRRAERWVGWTGGCGQPGRSPFPRPRLLIQICRMPYTLPRGYLSWSAYRLYQQCPAKFRLVYIDGHSEPTTPAQIEGSAFHQAAERMAVAIQTADRDQQPRPTPTDLGATAVAAYRDHLTEHGYPAEPTALVGSCRPALTALAARLHGSPLSVLAVEVSLGETAARYGRPTVLDEAGAPLLDFGGVPVKGFIDLHRGLGDGRVVEDHKHVSGLWSDSKGRRYWKYDPRTDGQLTLYGYAAATEQVGFVFAPKNPLTPATIRELQGHGSIDPQVQADVQAGRVRLEVDETGRGLVHWRARRDREAVERLMADFNRVAKAITRGDFPLCREDALCRGYCAFRGNACSRGRVAQPDEFRVGSAR